MRLPKRSEWLLLALSLSLTLIAADLALRRWAMDLFFPRAHDRFYLNNWPAMPLTPRFAAGAVYARDTFGDLAALLPDKDVRVTRHIRFATDQHGFPNPPGTSTRPLDLILVGDSFAAGDGITQPSSWAGLLRQNGLSVYTLGVSSSPWQQYMSLELMLPHLKVRPGTTVVWALFPGNDLFEPYYDLMDPARLPWSGPLTRLRLEARRFFRLSPLRQLVLRVWRRASGARSLAMRRRFEGRPVLFYEDYARGLDFEPAKVAAHENVPRLAKVMQAMKRACESRGLALHVLVVPMKEEVYRWLLKGEPAWSAAAGPAPIAEAMLTLCRQTGLECTDLRPPFVEASRPLYETRGEWLYWPDDSHWSLEGHKLAARTVETVLRP